MQQYTQELKKDTYKQARKNYKTKCIELTVVYDTELFCIYSYMFNINNINLKSFFFELYI